MVILVIIATNVTIAMLVFKTGTVSIDRSNCNNGYKNMMVLIVMITTAALRAIAGFSLRIS